LSAVDQRETKSTFLDAELLRESGPLAFMRAIERLLLHLGFDDIRNIDGAGDEGGDILAHRRRLRWVFQCKWTRGATVSDAAVREVDSAKAYYAASRAVVATNARPGRKAVELRSRLLSVGVKVDFWERDALKKFAADVIPEYPPSRIAPRVYQREAIECARRGLESEDRALVILATGLGKTAVAGELIHDHLSRQQAGAVLLLAHTKDLVRQLDRAMWRHLPKSVKTGVVTGDERRPTLEGVTAATVESGLT
jgi:predicted helicase